MLFLDIRLERRIKLVGSNTEIPLGILTSFIGAPFFIYLITRKGESY